MPLKREVCGLKNEDNKGLNLLKSGQKGFIHLIFSRVGLICLLLAFHIFLLFGIFRWFGNFLPHIYGGVIVFTVAVVLYLLNSRMDPSAKITWLIVILLLPVFGSLLFWYTRSDIGHRTLNKRFNRLTEMSAGSVSCSEGVAERISEEAPSAAALAHYLQNTGCYPAFDRTDVDYYSLGEYAWEEMLKQLEGAEHFIFMEYFIVDEGVMWGKILEILARKAKEGVEVRVMYDGTCEFSTLPHDYPKRLSQLGIKCKMFSPVTPFVSTHYNYRDHRKILVIDGHTAFTGGVNLADEYINRNDKHGHWKDTAVMLKGEAVPSFTLMFLQMWNIDEKQPDFGQYLTYPTYAPEKSSGYVIPYGDCPLDSYKVGEQVYMDILNRAQKYVHIMTPYLILDSEMETALKFAAERGVDVSVLLPGIPDHFAAHALAWTHYASLLDSGVKIYEYTPGFMHSKVFVSDDREAVVGTVNLDYRSLYHHFECAAYLYGTDCIPQIEKDFNETREKCRRITRESARKEKFIRKASGVLLKAIAPLL
ncbi:MAG: cardiolipin synthase [Clostridia bacterium]|nr:cardiolipin synthase [Clostridia bacterium]